MDRFGVSYSGVSGCYSGVMGVSVGVGVWFWGGLWDVVWVYVLCIICIVIYNMI